MRISRLLVGFAVSMLFVLGSAACDDADPEPGAGSRTPTASATSPTAVATPTQLANPYMVVLATPGETIVDANGYSAYSEVSFEVWDTGKRAVIAAYTIDGPLEIATPVWLNSHELFVHRPDRLDLYQYDGTFLETLVQVEPGRRLLGAALSNDGQYLAYVETAEGELTPESIADTRLVITEALSGEKVVELWQTDPKLAQGVWGQLSGVFWSPDSSYVVVDPITHSDSPTPYVVVYLDGTLFIPTRDEARQTGTEMEPFGRAAIVGFSYLGSGCAGPIDKEGNAVSFPLRWLDLASGEVLARTDVPQVPHAALWSPKGDEVIFGAPDCESGGDNPPAAWYRWSPSHTTPELLADPVALYRDWYGEQAVLIEQADGEVVLPNRWTWWYSLGYGTEGEHFTFGDVPLPAFPSADHLWLLGIVK